MSAAASCSRQATLLPQPRLKPNSRMLEWPCGCVTSADDGFVYRDCARGTPAPSATLAERIDAVRAKVAWLMAELEETGRRDAEIRALLAELRAILAPLLDYPGVASPTDRGVECLFCQACGVGGRPVNHRPDCPVLARDRLLGRGA